MRSRPWAPALLALLCVSAPAQVDLAKQLASASALERPTLLEQHAAEITTDLIKAIRDQSNTLSITGKYPAGLDVEQFALSLALRVGDKELEERCYHSIGFFQSQLGYLEEAVESYRKAAAIGEELKNPIRVARHILDLSSTLKNLGEYEEGLRYAERALQLAIDAHAAMEEARARNNIGTIHRVVGRRAAALEQYLMALEIAEREHLEAGISYLTNNIGGIYQEQGNQELALRYFQRSIQIGEKLKDAELSTALSNVADVYHALGRDSEATKSAERSLRLAQELGKKPKMAEPLLALAKIERDGKNFRGAIAHLASANEIALETKALNLQAQVLSEIAITRLLSGEPRPALTAALAAAAIARPQHDDITLGSALDSAAEASLRIGQRVQARSSSIEAITCNERLRDEAAGGAVDHEVFFERLLSPYQRLARMEADAGRIGAAFEFVERAKARVLTEVLDSGHASITRSMTAEEQAQERKLQMAITRAIEGKARDAARVDYQAFLSALYAKHPELRLNRRRSEPLPASRAGALLPDAQTAFLQFMVTPDETLLFTVTKSHGIRLFHIGSGGAKLRKQVEAYRDMVAMKDLDYEEAGRALYRLLLAPAQSELSGKTKLVVLPDGVLWQLPFQALVAGDGRFVAESQRVGYAPSVSVLASLSARTPPAGDRTKVLAMAQGFAEAEEEARALGGLYGTSAQVFTGAAARESVFKAKASAFGILHLASHGVLDNASPMYSYIALAKDGKEDGRLEAAELLNMDLKARLVVLSACDTARGRIGAGEGVLGLTWALAVAGVPATIASGWRVESKATSELMIELHRGLRRSLPPAAALQQSALKLMATPGYRHPFYWGAFAVYGLSW